ncbi:DUF4142 domain-containing protein [Streptomyces sp. CAI-85]|uniref:DUF4142 domain-containing protein n=1 Tax=Streptomyces sp. CAI-85 TaxID=1472662 RepID=UPI0015873182|nr:DUF4142 domain-containing protein [Streptomyces sp. CAI-85]NUV59791.1 DUF4142 domain-containing protein [Streptomyces sp. CAI-85]
MRPRPPVQGRGIISGTGLVFVCLAATLVALLLPVLSYLGRSDEDGSDGGVDVLNAQSVVTPYGPLSALDQEFVTKVRLAGLWELPAGVQAEEKGTTDAVRTAGRHLVEGHTFLDERARDVAAKLGLPLPNEPDEQQRTWLAELDAARGRAFDWTFANTLRVAHGRVFSLVAQVRAGTRNSLVRALADDANSTVLDHIRVLEATGLVDYDALARELATGGPPSSTRSTAPPGLTGDPGTVVPLSPPPDPDPNPTDPDPAPSYPLPPAATGPPSS